MAQMDTDERSVIIKICVNLCLSSKCEKTKKPGLRQQICHSRLGLNLPLGATHFKSASHLEIDYRFTNFSASKAILVLLLGSPVLS